MLTKKTTLLMLLMTAQSVVFAQQFTYKPINPAFGGDTFNYQWLIQSAEQQNKFTDPAQNQTISPQSELDAFQAGINRQILSQLQRSLLSLNQDLSGGLTPGTFSIGDLELEVIETANGFLLTILDTTTGDQTQITVPRSSGTPATNNRN